MKHHAAHDLEEEDDVDSFASSFASSSDEEPTPSDNMDEDNFHDAEDAAPPSDNSPDQGAAVADFNPTKLEASHTKLIIEAVKDLEMDSAQNDDTDAPEEDNQAVGKGEPSAEDDVNEEQRAYDLRQDEAFHNRISNPETFYDHL